MRKRNEIRRKSRVKQNVELKICFSQRTKIIRKKFNIINFKRLVDLIDIYTLYKIIRQDFKFI